MKAQELSPCPEETGVVKSAIRTLEILEYFDEVQQPLNIVAVATALDYPPSSAAALLRSLTTMGYLHYNARKRTYVPTDRVPFLGSWINPALFQEAGLPRLMRAIRRRTGQVVVLAARNNDMAQYIHVLNEPKAVTHHIRIGQRRALAPSGVGQILLSAMIEKDVKRLYHRMNAYAKAPEDRIDVPALLAQLAVVRKRGYAFSRNLVVEGYGMIALSIPLSCTSQPLALGVGGQCEALEAREVEIIQIIREEMRIYLKTEAAEDVTPASHRHKITIPALASINTLTMSELGQHVA